MHNPHRKPLQSFLLPVEALLNAQSTLHASCVTSNLNSPITNSILTCNYSTAPSSTSQKTSLPHIILLNSRPSRIIGLLSAPVLILVLLSAYLFLLCVSVSLCSPLRMPQQERSTFAAPATVCSSAKSLPRGSPVPGHIGEKFVPCVCVCPHNCETAGTLCLWKRSEAKETRCSGSSSPSIKAVLPAQFTCSAQRTGWGNNSLIRTATSWVSLLHKQYERGICMGNMVYVLCTIFGPYCLQKQGVWVYNFNFQSAPSS